MAKNKAKIKSVQKCEHHRTRKFEFIMRLTMALDIVVQCPEVLKGSSVEILHVPEDIGVT